MAPFMEQIINSCIFYEWAFILDFTSCNFYEGILSSDTCVKTSGFHVSLIELLPEKLLKCI